MFRTIYHTPELGYRVLDRINDQGSAAIERSLENAGASIICTIDFGNKMVFGLCTYFLDHKDQIDPMLFDCDYIQL